MMTKTWAEVKALICNTNVELIEQYEKDYEYGPDSILTFGMEEKDWDNMFLLTDKGLVAIGKWVTLAEMVERGKVAMPEVGLGQKYREDTTTEGKDKPNKNSGRLMNIKEYAALMEWKD
jgi:hypothetical protein